MNSEELGDGWLNGDEWGFTGIDGVWTGGDNINLGIATTSIGQARKAADCIHAKLQGTDAEDDRTGRDDPQRTSSSSTGTSPSSGPSARSSRRRIVSPIRSTRSISVSPRGCADRERPLLQLRHVLRLRELLDVLPEQRLQQGRRRRRPATSSRSRRWKSATAARSAGRNVPAASSWVSEGGIGRSLDALSTSHGSWSPVSPVTAARPWSASVLPGRLADRGRQGAAVQEGPGLHRRRLAGCGRRPTVPQPRHLSHGRRGDGRARWPPPRVTRISSWSRATVVSSTVSTPTGATRPPCWPAPWRRRWCWSSTCTKMTRTAAALVLGCRALDPEVDLAGVILNRVGSGRQESVVREAMAGIAGNAGARRHPPPQGRRPAAGSSPRVW